MRTFKNNLLTEEDELWINENTSVSGYGNGSYKSEINNSLKWYEFPAINDLKSCYSDTPPIKIAYLLEEIFKHWPAQEGHWLWISQHYNPRTINWILKDTIKKFISGAIVTNPSAFFTFKIKFRKKRKEFRRSNGSS